MAAFPDTVMPRRGSRWGDTYRTLRGFESDNGIEVRVASRVFPLWSASLDYPLRPRTEYAEHIQFFRTVRGSLTSFTYWHPEGAETGGVLWEDLYVATLDGSDATWDLPFKGGATGYTIVKNVTTLADPGDYSITASGGTDSRDLLTLASAGSAGDVIWATATGRRAINVRFASDVHTVEMQHGTVIGFHFDLKEVA